MPRGRRGRRASVAALTVVTLLTTGVAHAASGTRPPNPQAADAALDQALTKLVQTKGGPPGAIAVVQRGDAIDAHAAGAGEVAGGTPPGVDDAVRIANVSMAFNGAAALLLVSDGTLSLSDSIGKRLPTLPRAWRRVTLRQALQHTSGLPDFSTTKAWQQAVNASPLQPPPPPQLLSYVRSKPLDFAPGSAYRFSNTDNVVVGLMIEAATGSTYADVLQARVDAPLGLTATSLPVDSTMPSPYIRGYAVHPPNAPEDLSEGLAAGWLWAAGGNVSTQTETNRFIRAYVAGATSKQLTSVAGQSNPPGPGTNASGLGVFRYQTRCGTVYGHTGSVPGYTQFAAATRDGSRSTTVAVNEQVSTTANVKIFPALRRIFELATCAAFAGS
jgi:D-alanyl-D-alanine carboxypeptidase